MHALLENNEILGVKDFRDFIDEAGKRRRKSTLSKSAINMYNGNMWDFGRGYIGPLPVKGDTEASQIVSDLKRRFTSRNVIEEIVDRAVDGLLGKSPDWKIYNNKDIGNSPRLRAKPKPLPQASFSAEGERIAKETLGKPEEPDAKIQEAEYILSELWSSAKLGDCLKQSVTQFMLEGRGKLRIYMPTKKFDTVAEFTEVVKLVRVQFVDNTKAEILDDGADKLSIVEISKAKDSKKVYEVSFVDDNGRTFIGSIDGEKKPTEQDKEEDDVEEIIKALEGFNELSTPMNLGGNITTDEILGKPFVTESMLQNNRALNLDLTLGIGVLIESGYTQMVTSNVALKKRTVPDPNNPGETIEEDIPLEQGATTLINLVGEQTTDSQGNTNFAPVGVHWKEPSPLDTFVSGEELYYRQLLAEAKQLFVLTTDDNIMSGESRVQARQDFLKKEQRYKPSVDNHIDWLLNTLLDFTASACGKDGYFEDFSVVSDCKVSAGELSADEKDVVISQYSAEPPLISRETAMVLLGTEDPLIEIDKIRQDQAEKLELQVRRLEATAKFGNMEDNGQPKATPDEKATKKEKSRRKSK